MEKIRFVYYKINFRHRSIYFSPSRAGMPTNRAPAASSPPRQAGTLSRTAVDDVWYNAAFARGIPGETEGRPGSSLYRRFPGEPCRWPSPHFSPVAMTLRVTHEG